MSRSVAGVQRTTGSISRKAPSWSGLYFDLKSVAYGLPALKVDSKMHRFMRTGHSGRFLFKEQ